MTAILLQYFTRDRRKALAIPETDEYSFAKLSTVKAQYRCSIANRPKTPSLTLAASVVAAIQGRIDARSLAPGARLPSVRGLAETMKVSKSTVVEAYDRLIAEGAIVARRGSGFYVAGPTRPLSLAALGPQLDRAIDPLWLMRQSLQSGPDVLKPGSGWLPESWMPDLSVQRGLRAIARGPAPARIQYDAPLGFAPLRLHHARRLAERGVNADPNQILLTNSASQSLDLLCRFLLEPGDAVLVDDPCYFNFLALLRAHRVKAIGVPFTPDGPDVDAFARMLVAHRPRFYLTIAGLHNPTGATLSPVVAHRVLKLAEKHDIIIVEDDIFADFEPEPAPRFAGFDGFDRVIQVGSLSKTFRRRSAAAISPPSPNGSTSSSTSSSPSARATAICRRRCCIACWPTAAIAAISTDCAPSCRRRWARPFAVSAPWGSSPGSSRAAACSCGRASPTASTPPTSRGTG